MRWRPEGWRNPFMKELDKGEGGIWDGGIQFEHPRFNDFEAGADAMLEGLIAKPSSVKVARYCEYYGDEPTNGTWVFIPDKIK